MAFQRKSTFTKPPSTGMTGKPPENLGVGSGRTNAPVIVSSTPTPYVTSTGFVLQSGSSFLSLTGKPTNAPVEVAATDSSWGRKSDTGIVYGQYGDENGNQPVPVDTGGSGTGGGSGGTGGDGSGGSDPFSQLVDLASGLLGGGGGSISVPESGSYVVPGQSGGVSPLALIALVGGLGAVGYWYYQKQKGA